MSVFNSSDLPTAARFGLSVLLISFVSIARAAPSSEVREFMDVSLDADTVTLQLNEPVQEKVFRLGDPPRIVVDLPGATYAGPTARLPGKPGSAIKRVRAGLFSKTPIPVSRIVIETAEGASYSTEWEGGRLRLSLSRCPDLPAFAKKVLPILENHGRISDASGRPLTGSYLLTFKLLSQDGKDTLWEDSKYIRAEKGVYQDVLSSNTPIPCRAFSLRTMLAVDVPRGTGWVVRTNNYRVQVGSFSDRGRALTLVESLLGDFPSASLEKTVINGAPFYRVEVGPHDFHFQAALTVNKLKDRGFTPVVVPGIPTTL